MLQLTNEQRKQLIEKYPYLQPRNLWTGEMCKDYDYSWIRGESELPCGWFKLFLLFCKNARPLLEDANYLNRYNLSQVKEKYGSMRIYDFGAPNTVHRLVTMFEAYSTNVCIQCGNFATIETQGWIEPLCDSCYETGKMRAQYHRIKQLTHAGCLYYEKDGNYEYKVYYSLKQIDNEYRKILKMSDTEFMNYILN